MTDGGYSVETEREKHVSRTTIIEIVWCTKFKKSSFDKFLQFFATIVYWIYWRMDQYAGVSLLAFIAPGVPTQSFTIDGWLHGWMERGRSFGAQKTMFLGNISKITQDFFRSVSRPLRRVFNTSFVKISTKKNIYWKKNRTFFWRFFQFLQVCTTGGLIDFLEVFSRGVLEAIFMLTDGCC